MNKPWTPQHTVTPTDARQLIEAQFPGLVPAQVEPLSAGWDNTAFVVNGALVFRFPHRAVGAETLAEELRVLPSIVGRLPLPIPDPQWIGAPMGDYPWAFMGYETVPGQTACRARLSTAQRARLAGPLGHVLRALHDIPAKEAFELSAQSDALGRIDVERCRPWIEARMKEILAVGLVPDASPWQPIMASSGGLRAPNEVCLVHGDLYARHVMVDDDGALCGIIDWGDTHVGDPAVDLAVVHSMVPKEAHGAFFETYGPVDAQTWALARFRALHSAVAIVTYANEIKDKALLDEGLAAMGFIAAS